MVKTTDNGDGTYAHEIEPGDMSTALMYALGEEWHYRNVERQVVSWAKRTGVKPGYLSYVEIGEPPRNPKRDK